MSSQILLMAFVRPVVVCVSSARQLFFLLKCSHIFIMLVVWPETILWAMLVFYKQLCNIACIVDSLITYVLHMKHAVMCFQISNHNPFISWIFCSIFS